MDTEYLGQMMAGVAYLLVGLGLVRLAWRTGERPEKRLSCYFVLTGLDYLLYTAPFVFGLGSISVVLAAGSRLAYAIAVVALLMFTREVFRSTESWASWLSWVLGAGMLGSIGWGYAEGDWVGKGPDSVVYWSYFLGYFGACVWLSVEALLAYAGARKRQAIGLCDSIVVNRYLLWGSFGMFQVLACFGVVLVDVQAAGSGEVARWADLFLTAGEFASVAMLWLAFFPPAVYLNWIGRASESTGSTADAAIQEAS